MEKYEQMLNEKLRIKCLGNHISKCMEFWTKIIWLLSSVLESTNYCMTWILGLKRLKNSGYSLPGSKRELIKLFYSGENRFSS